MRKIIYDVAVTIDGFIADENGSVHCFAMEGPHVGPYQARLASYDTVLMGRKTYEVGYEYGLKPGQRGYPHMAHYIVSQTLRFDDDAAVEVVREDPAGLAKKLKQADGGNIYLCGGGALARTLLEHGLIDELVLKLNPVLIGSGIPLFGERTGPVNAKLISTESYDNGVVLMHYDLTTASDS